MKPGAVAIVGASETEQIGKLPGISEIELHADAALRALDDAGLSIADVDGIAAVGDYAAQVAAYFRITPSWIDGTNVGGCSFLLLVRHAAAAIEMGYCSTVLITHGESGRSGNANCATFHPLSSSPLGQFEMPFGSLYSYTQFNMPLLRYMKTYDVTEEHLATVSTITREWAMLNPRAYARDPLTVDDVLSSRQIAWPITKLMCCLVTDGGGALVLTKADRAKDMRSKPVFLLGSGEGVENILSSQISSMTEFPAYKIAAKHAFRSAGLKPGDMDHAMLYDAFAPVPLWLLEEAGFVQKGEAASFYSDRQTAPGGSLPVNTNGGGLSYTHTGMYGMFAIQESVRQLRNESSAQIPGVTRSYVQGVGNFFEASGALILGNDT